MSDNEAMEESSRRRPRKKVAVVGQGHVGIRLAMAAAEVGFDVVGFDTDETLVKELSALGSKSLARRAASIAEGRPSPQRAALDGVDAMLLGALVSSGSYRPTAQEGDLSGFDIGLIAVPTPTLDDGTPDLRALEAAAASLGRHLRPGAAVSVESTVYPGATVEVVAPALEAASGLVAGRDFHLGYSPERIDTGNPIASLASTPKLVSGIDSASLRALSAFYSRIVEEVVEVAGTAEAELAKLIENTFRQVNVALVNEIALVAGAIGVDVREALEAAATKPFGYMAFNPGPGPGGRCLTGAASHLAWAARRAGAELMVVEAAGRVNATMPHKVVERVVHALARARTEESRDEAQDLSGRRLLLLGLAYKPGVGETKGSAAVTVANALAALGAEVVASDPLVEDCPELDVRVRLLRSKQAAGDGRGGFVPGRDSLGGSGGLDGLGGLGGSGSIDGSGSLGGSGSIGGSGGLDGPEEPGYLEEPDALGDLAAEVASADAVVLLVDHPCFDLDAIARHARLVVDARYRIRSGASPARLAEAPATDPGESGE